MKIAKERRPSEFETQAKALHTLREILGDNYIVAGEYDYRGCRFDIAIFKADSRDLVCTIEIKRWLIAAGALKARLAAKPKVNQ